MCIKKKKEYAITLDKAWSLSKEWKKTAIIWRTLDHIFVLGSFTASIFAAYIAAESDNGTSIIIILSSLAALLTLIGFACNPSKYMTNYRKAFDILNDALVTNTDADGQLINGDNGRNTIIEAIKQGEKYIGKTFDVDECTKDEVCIPYQTVCRECSCQKNAYMFSQDADIPNLDDK